MRLLLAPALFLALIVPGTRSLAHAGHDHGPEAPVETAGEVAPRFYAQSQELEAVLVFPDGGHSPQEKPTLYILSRSNNSPLEAAEVKAEILSGGEGDPDVVPGPERGAYQISGLGDARSTMSLMVEVTSDDLFEILSLDNVIVPESDTAMNDTEAESAGRNSGTLLGLPRYLVIGLIAMNILVGAVILLSAGFWLVGQLGRRKRSRRAIAGQSAGGAALICLFVGMAFPRSASAHAGEDHSGAALAASAALTSATRHFVPVQTQVQGDIRTTYVQERVLPRSFKALGRVEVRSDHRAVLTPPVEGRLVLQARNGPERKVPVVGETVEKGETLVVVEQILPAAEKVTLTTERAQLEAELRSAEQELALAVQDRERAERLAKVISTQELEQSRARQKIAEEKIGGLRERLNALNSALSGTGPTVREVAVLAPISGMITEAHATLGEYVTRDKALFTIVNLDEVFVGADVFESDLQSIQGARRARITLEAFPDEAFEGTLHAISQEIDPDTRAIHVLFNVKNPEHKLRGGAFTAVAIESDDRHPLVVVPKTAVLSQDGVRQVLKKVTPEVFAATPVIVSEFREDVAVVEHGLAPGDRIAVSGLYQIRMSPTLGRER